MSFKEFIDTYTNKQEDFTKYDFPKEFVNALTVNGMQRVVDIDTLNDLDLSSVRDDDPYFYDSYKIAMYKDLYAYRHYINRKISSHFPAVDEYDKCKDSLKAWFPECSDDFIKNALFYYYSTPIDDFVAYVKPLLEKYDEENVLRYIILDRFGNKKTDLLTHERFTLGDSILFDWQKIISVYRIVEPSKSAGYSDSTFNIDDLYSIYKDIYTIAGDYGYSCLKFILVPSQFRFIIKKDESDINNYGYAFVRLIDSGKASDVLFRGRMYHDDSELL